ncbi:MAG: shikimate kinase [Aquihabitans sp.]
MPEASPGVRATHVVLVGLMGSGKTTVGKKVAKLIGHRFVDADVEIEARTGRSVASWFEDGEPAFRAAEAELLEALLAEPEALVVGAGGGVVVTESNRRRLQEGDVTAVYLHGTPEFLASRVQAKAHRPLLADDPLAVMQQMYQARDGWYREVADAVVEVRPHHEAGEKPKWRIAEQVVEELIALHVVDPAAVTSPEVLR